MNPQEQAVINFIQRYKPDSVDIVIELGWYATVVLERLIESGKVKRCNAGMNTWYEVVESEINNDNRNVYDRDRTLSV